MPWVTVWGLPSNTKERTLDKLEQEINYAIVCIEELNVQPKDVTILDMVKARKVMSGVRPIVVEVAILERVRRTEIVRTRLALTVRKCVETMFEGFAVDCIIKVVKATDFSSNVA